MSLTAAADEQAAADAVEPARQASEAARVAAAQRSEKTRFILPLLCVVAVVVAVFTLDLSPRAELSCCLAALLLLVIKSLTRFLL